MSDEEKKAIEYWQYIRDTQIYNGYKGQVYAVALVNLIEKQSKEIEELINEVMEKELIIDGLKEDRRIAVEEIQEQYYISKDKIKAKIEELKKIKKKLEEESSDYPIKEEWIQANIGIMFLQELLEKE